MGESITIGIIGGAAGVALGYGGAAAVPGQARQPGTRPALA